jgi:Flp pilus assembly pilin Flp
VRVIAWRLWRDRRGSFLIDYTLLIGLITLTVLGAVIAIGSWAHGMWVNFLSSLGLTKRDRIRPAPIQQFPGSNTV